MAKRIETILAASFMIFTLVGSIWYGLTHQGSQRVCAEGEIATNCSNP